MLTLVIVLFGWAVLSIFKILSLEERVEKLEQTVGRKP